MFSFKHLVAVLSLFVLDKVWAIKHGVTIGQSFLGESVDPTVGSASWALTSHGVAEKLFTVDQNGEIVPQVAESIRKINEKEWEVTLKDDYWFSDGTAVTAQRVADALTELNEKNPSASSSLGKITVTPKDDKTFTIESERPTFIMESVLAEWVFVVYMKAPNGDYLFTGPYEIESFGEQQIDLVPNMKYPIQPPEGHMRPEIHLRKFVDGHELAKAVENHTVDVGFNLPSDTLTDLRASDGVRVKSFKVGYHYMVFYNIDSLPDIRVRQAMDLAINRTALSQVLGGGYGTRSLFPDYSPFYSDDHADPHGDPDKAKELLDQAGWTLNEATGKREKDGKELVVNLVAYPQRPALAIMQPVIAKSLENLGITVNSILTGPDWSETQAHIDDRTFDMLMWAQYTLPAGDPGWFLNAFFRSDGGNNYAKLQSDKVDTILDTLSMAEEHDTRVTTAKSAQRAILDEVPVSNLVTPYWHVALDERMAHYEPWESDYYIIRDDLYVDEHDGHGHDEHPEDAGEELTIESVNESSASLSNIQLAFRIMMMMVSGLLVTSIL